ncbi:MAG: hypothetical protein HRT58_20710 [Crocinitomicaceae bacterium]|nr:hypothetical protein [Flavobacteriales bacterium]NQZ38094.1 hypothetical protein [Crocinitomicaceae bacterium]
MGKAAVICILLLWNFGYSQITSIPDPIFEQKLIDLGYDSAPINGEILTDSISSILTLDT